MNKDTKKYDYINYLTKAMFIITEKCNMKCKYCYSNEYRYIDDLDVNKAKRVIDFLFKNAIKKRILFKKETSVKIYFHGGGEPTVRLNIIESIVDYANYLSKKNKINVKYKIATNGILIDKCIELFYNNNFKVRVSLDTNNPKNIKRLYNNKSSFDIVYKNIKLLEKYKIQYSISVVICNDDIKYLFKFAKYLMANFPNAEDVSFPLVSENSLTNSQKIYRPNIMKYFSVYLKVAKMYINKKYSSYGKYMELKEFVKSKNNIICENLTLRAIVVHSNGDIIGCSELPMIDKLIYGKINEQISFNYSNIENCIENLNNKNSKCKHCSIVKYCLFTDLNCIKGEAPTVNVCRKLIKKYKKIFNKEFKYVFRDN